MYEFIKGKIVNSSPLYIVLETNGIGYKIFCPPNILSQLTATNDQVIIYTSFVIRENSQALYGFATRNIRDIFETLTNVSGIGPKTALSLIGHMQIDDLQSAITRGDSAFISKVPGIGKKTAERLILELRDKLPALFPMEKILDNHSTYLSDQKTKDAITALIHLGYKEKKAQKAVEKALQKLDSDCDLSSLITTSLKNI